MPHLTVVAALTAAVAARERLRAHMPHGYAATIAAIGTCRSDSARACVWVRVC